MSVPSVLIVEDNPTTRKFFRVALEAEGYRVREAFDGRGAMAAIATERPDLVLLDLVLPDIDGVALAAKIRGSTAAAAIPLVAVSGFPRLIDRACLESGAFNGVLVKPVPIAHLVETVGSFLVAPKPNLTSEATPASILVVDDDPVQLKLTRVRLELEGFRVATAQDETQALTQARTSPPDAILCDVLMPDTDGFELCLAIRRDPALARVPVVLVSAHYGGERDEDLARQVGASALVTRTPDVRAIVVALRQAIGEGVASAPTPDLPSDKHTDRVIAQLKRHVRANAGLAERLAIQAAQFSILAGITDALARSEDVEEAFGDVLAACLDAGGVSAGALYRTNAQSKLAFSHSLGFPEAMRPLLPSVFGYPVLLESAMQGAVISPAALLPEADRARLLERAAAKSLVLVPLARDRRCVGAMLLASSFSEVGESELIAFGRAIAAQVAQAMAMASAVDRLRDAAEASRELGASLDPRKTLDTFGRLATQRLADVCEVAVEGDETRVYTAPDARGHQAGLRLVADPAHTLVVTLAASGRPLGTVTLTRGPRRAPFAKVERLFAEDLVQRTALALENSRLYAALTDANRLKDEFLGTVSHELRTPLNAILGWSRLLAKGLDEAKRNQAAQVIARNAKAQAQLVDDLLDISAIMSGKTRLRLATTDLKSSIEAVLETLKPAMDLKGIELWPSEDRPAVAITADPDRLRQMIWNLVGNAIKFSPSGGHVGIDFERVGSHVVLRVSDDGQGIDEAFLPHVFERFKQADGSTTRRQGGLGLGLAITRHLVELHGGQIEATSEGLGRGSTFTLTLPMRDERRGEPTTVAHESEPAETAEYDRASELQNLAVLVVDDEKDCRDLIVAILEQCGARPTPASSCEEAIGVFGRVRPDVVLSDIGMPGEDGLTLIQKIRSLSPSDGGKVPAAALSGYARKDDRTRAVSAGFQMHLAKPIDPAHLVAVVADLSRVAMR